jgi:hypothetical protein
MKTKEVKVSELSGYALDWCVGKLIWGKKITTLGSGHKRGVWLISGDNWYTNYKPYHPSTEWEQGGPIIEREKITLQPVVNPIGWIALPVQGLAIEASTALIAAMRCFVASKMGDTVSIPLELLEV